MFRTGPTGVTWWLTSAPLGMYSAWLRRLFRPVLKCREGMGEGSGGYGRL